MAENDQPEISGQALFSKNRLLPGDSLQIQISSDTSTVRYQVRFIGVHAPHSVLVSLPVVMGKLVFMKEGKELLVRAFVGRDAVAYRAQVIKSRLSPYPYMHLTYPESVQSMRIRKSARVPVDIVAAIISGTAEYAARINDISCGGARLSSKQVLGAEGDEIATKFRITSGTAEVYLNVTSVILNSAPDELNPGVVTTGIQFLNLKEKHRLYLQNLVFQQMMDDTP
jgi:c-di-GMP-binding flagellar brake protein YcgR